MELPPLSNINTLSCRKAMRCNKNINTGTLFDLHKIMRAEVERGMWQNKETITARVIKIDKLVTPTAF